MAGNGVGIAIVPLTAAERYQRELRLRLLPLSDSWARRHLVLCIRDADALPTYVRALMQHILTQEQQ